MRRWHESVSRWGAPVLHLGALCFAGCSNFSTLQTARTLPAGTYRVHAGGGAFTTNQLSPVATSSTTTTQRFVFPYVELGGRVGLMKHLDLGAKYTLPGSISAEVKWQLVNSSAFAAAVGFQAAYMPLSLNGTIAKLVDLVVPVYLSYDFNEWLGAYAAVRYMQRFQVGSNPSSTPFYAAGGGFRLGDRVGVLAEVTYVRQGGSTFEGLQFGGAFFFGSASSTGLVPEPDSRANRGTPRSDSPQDGSLKTRPSVVLSFVDKGKALRVSQEEGRPWRGNELVCVVDSKRRETACGTVVGIAGDAAVVRLKRRKGKVEPGMEVIVRP